MKKKVSGFTLVELSIVLIIIGFVVSGVSYGLSLTTESKYRTIVSEHITLQTAIYNFQYRFGQLPGDMTNAFNYFAGTNCTNATITNRNAGNTACNGNGNGSINVQDGESVKAFYQLAKAGMLSGNFSGTWVTTGTEDATNTMTSKWPGAGYFLVGWWPPFGCSNNCPAIIHLGGFIAGWEPAGLIFTPLDMYAIDKKIDDGIPASGSFSGADGMGTPASCYSGNAYLTSTTTKSCRSGYIIIRN
jgi:prepilin-type N-terminal cleavage/methylation domain-containing protein